MIRAVLSVIVFLYISNDSMSTRQWFILYNNSVRGPFTSGQLRQLAQNSQITPDVQVRLGENGQWRAALSIHGLFNAEVGQGNRVDCRAYSASSELSLDDMSTLVPEICSLEESPIAGPVPPMMNSSGMTGEISSGAPPLPGGGSVPPIKTSGMVGEVSSDAPPLPGSGATPSANPRWSGSNSFGEVRSEAPPLPGNDSTVPPIGPPPTSKGLFSFLPKVKRSRKVVSDVIPKLIKTLLASDEKVLYTAHPESLVLILQCIIYAVIYLFVGLTPAIVAYLKDYVGGGICYGVIATIVFAIVTIICYLQWLHTCYVITNTRTFVKSGILSVYVGYLFNSNIQMFRIRTGFIDRLLGLNTIELRTAAGLLSLKYIPLTTVLPFYGKQ